MSQRTSRNSFAKYFDKTSSQEPDQVSVISKRTSQGHLLAKDNSENQLVTPLVKPQLAGRFSLNRGMAASTKPILKKSTIHQ